MATRPTAQTTAHVRTSASRSITSIFAWVLTILLAIAFILAGGIKLTNAPGMVQEFALIGLGQWFRYFTGVLEVSGAIGLFIPRVRLWAALQIAVVMIGATFANLTVLHLPNMALVTVILLALALVLAWMRRGAFDRR